MILASGRVAKLRNRLAEASSEIKSGAESDASFKSIIVSKPTNIRWLTGFTGSNGLLLITESSLLLVTDNRYEVQAAQELSAAGVEAEIVIAAGSLGETVAAVLSCFKQVGFEAHYVTWDDHKRLASWLPKAMLVPSGEMVEELRQVKDPAELALLRRASFLADEALVDVVGVLGSGISEREVARLLDNRMRELGADEPSYDTIVGSGPNAALPHATPSDRVISPGETVVIDVGARLDGYGSDMTRTFVVGEASADKLGWYEAVRAAQAAGVDGVQAGVDEVEIDTICRTVLADHGLADRFVHGTGHGIGLEIHEQPILSPRSVGILRAGLVITVEPGVYLPKRGGVRIEDSVVVTSSGCEVITRAPKQFVI